MLVLLLLFYIIFVYYYILYLLLYIYYYSFWHIYIYGSLSTDTVTSRWVLSRWECPKNMGFNSKTCIGGWFWAYSSFRTHIPNPICLQWSIVYSSEWPICFASPHGLPPYDIDPFSNLPRGTLCRQARWICWCRCCSTIATRGPPSRKPWSTSSTMTAMTWKKRAAAPMSDPILNHSFYWLSIGWYLNVFDIYQFTLWWFDTAIEHGHLYLIYLLKMVIFYSYVSHYHGHL